MLRITVLCFYMLIGYQVGYKHFRFERFWLELEEAKEVIEETWMKSIESNSLLNIFQIETC